MNKIKGLRHRARARLAGSLLGHSAAPATAMEGDERVLTYGDVVLRRSDVDTLSAPQFLNDVIIEFYFAYLAKGERIDAGGSDDEDEDGDDDDVYLVSPSMGYLIMSDPDPAELPALVAPLHLQRRRLILLAVNDNSDPTAAGGGSHWSLLAYDRASNAFLHFDSMGGANDEYARRMFGRIKRLAGGEAVAATFVPHQAGNPHQENGYDCGAYVMATARALVRHHRSGGGSTGLTDAVRREVTAESVAELRSATLELILSLSKSHL